MKNLLLASFVLMFMSCNSTKDMQVTVKKAHFEKTMSQKNDMNITQKWQVVPNAQINFKKDDFGVGMAKLEKGNKTVFYYKYDTKPLDKSIMDAGYTQEIFFEIEGDIKNMSLKDKELSKINLLVGKHGFFRGSGVYTVDAGSFDLKVTAYDQVELTIDIVKPTEMVQQKHIHQINELNQNENE
jgi:hypothetical protein